MAKQEGLLIDQPSLSADGLPMLSWTAPTSTGQTVGWQTYKIMFGVILGMAMAGGVIYEGDWTGIYRGPVLLVGFGMTFLWVLGMAAKQGISTTMPKKSPQQEADERRPVTKPARLNTYVAEGDDGELLFCWNGTHQKEGWSGAIPYKALVSFEGLSADAVMGSAYNIHRSDTKLVLAHGGSPQAAMIANHEIDDYALRTLQAALSNTFISPRRQLLTVHKRKQIAAHAGDSASDGDYPTEL